MSTDSGATWGTALNYKGQRGDEDKTIQITSTAGTISANFASQINVCNDSGNIAVVPSFTNMPIYSCERLLIINNAGTASITIAMPTADLVVGNKTYKFVNMDTGTLTIPASKSAEFSFLILMTLTPNVFEVRIKNSIQS